MSVRHIVLFRFKAEVPPEQVDGVVQAFAALRHQVPGIEAFECGTNSSGEGLHRGLTHAFLLTFDSVASRDAYLPHPAHQAFVRQLEGIVDDVLVFDYAPSAR